MTAQTEAANLFAFDNSYARLPDRFFARLPPTPVAAPRLVRLNETLARHLRLDPAPEGVAILAGIGCPREASRSQWLMPATGSGTFVPQLGDGRAIVLGEVVDRDSAKPQLNSLHNPR